MKTKGKEKEKEKKKKDEKKRSEEKKITPGTEPETSGSPGQRLTTRPRWPHAQ